MPLDFSNSKKGISIIIATTIGNTMLASLSSFLIKKQDTYSFSLSYVAKSNRGTPPFIINIKRANLYNRNISNNKKI